MFGWQQGCARDLGVTQQGILNFSGLNAHAFEFKLPVAAPEKVKLAVEIHQPISGLIALAMGLAVQIARTETCAAENQLTGKAPRQEMSLGISNLGPEARQQLANSGELAGLKGLNRPCTGHHTALAGAIVIPNLKRQPFGLKWGQAVAAGAQAFESGVCRPGQLQEQSSQGRGQKQLLNLLAEQGFL